MGAALKFIKQLYKKRFVLRDLTIREFQHQIRGSVLGVLLLFLKPLAFILVVYVIFTLGIRTPQADADVPYGVFLVSGMVAWLFFAQAFGDATHSIRDYRFLINKVDFKLSLLPVVKIFSALIPHTVLLLLAIVLLWVSGWPPTLYTLQVIFYLLLMVMMLLGIGWLTSTCSLFMKDIVTFVTIATQFGFWVTPVFWQITMVPEAYRWIFELNPMAYIVGGYRDSLIYGIGFWERPWLAFWNVGVIVAILWLGMTTYRRLRPELPEIV